MIFVCGNYGPFWHRWFAWRPVPVGKTELGQQKYAWLETVARKLVYLDYKPVHWLYYTMTDAKKKGFLE